MQAPNVPKLSCGSCRFHAKKRRRREESQRHISLFSSSFLLIHESGECQRQRFLCRLIGERSYVEKDSVALCYDSSIRICGSFSADHFRASSKELLKICPGAKEYEGCPNQSTHQHVQLSCQSRMEWEDVTDETSFVLSLDLSPTPILSLSATIYPELPTSMRGMSVDRARDPLFQSSLKRQLVGCAVLHMSESNILATEIIVFFEGMEWRARVETVTVASAQNRGRPLLGLILPSTRITTTLFHEEQTDPLLEPSLLNVSPSLGTSPTAQILTETIQSIRQHSKNAGGILSALCRAYLLSGPPGVGKTHAVRLAVQACDRPPELPCRYMGLSGSDLLSRGSNVSDAARSLQTVMLQAIHSATPSSKQHFATTTTILFLDECDALMCIPLLASMMASLLDRLSESSSQMVVVAATNRADSLPEFLKRRFDKELVLSPPTIKEREDILQALWHSNFSSSLQTLLNPREITEIAETCVGYVPADLMALVRRVNVLHTIDGSISIWDCFQQALIEVGASALRDAALCSPPTTTWGDIVGDAGGAKTALRQAIEWPRTKSTAYHALGLTPPRGILLHGPPGCAKTSLARAAAGSSGIAFISFSPADVFSSSYVGEAEAVVRRAFTLARSAAPCILFFDEIDSILGSESSSSSGNRQGMTRGILAEARVLSTFLNEMDGVNGSVKDGVLVLGATNRPWTLDAALLRPGRFDKVIFVPPPDFDARKSILEMHRKNWSSTLDVSNIDVQYLASKEVTGGMTGAELVGACNEVALKTFRTIVQNKALDQLARVDENDFVAVLKSKNALSKTGALEEYLAFISKMAY